MTVVCAWCRRLPGTKPPADDSSTTHGICPPCRDRVLATLPRRVHNHGIDPSCLMPLFVVACARLLQYEANFADPEVPTSDVWLAIA